MNRAAIVIESKGFDKNLSMIFKKPWIAEKILIEINKEEYEITVLQVPYSNNLESLDRNRKVVEKYCHKKGLQRLIYDKAQELSTKDKLIAIKILCSLIMMENTDRINIFNKRFGIIFNNLNPLIIDALSREASSIIILDQEFDTWEMEKLYQKVIKDKGLSIVYTKDLTSLIEKSDIIIGENTLSIEKHGDLLSRKIIFFNDWDKIKLIPNSLNYQDDSSYDYSYSDDIVEVFLNFNQSMGIWDVAMCFSTKAFTKINL